MSSRHVLPIVLLGLAALAPVASAAPTLRVNPSSVPPGGAVTFTGSGWKARAVVDLLIGPPRSEADQFSWARTSASGRFRKTVRMSSQARPGRYVVLACRRSCRVKASARLTITTGRAVQRTATAYDAMTPFSPLVTLVR